MINNNENNFHKKEKNGKIIIAVLLLIAVIGVGYAMLGATVQINGTSQISDASWDVHFKSGTIMPTSGSVTIDTSAGQQGATIDNATQISYAVCLAVPGDFYEFSTSTVNS